MTRLDHTIGLLQDPVTRYGIITLGRKWSMGLSKQTKAGLNCSFVLEFASQHNRPFRSSVVPLFQNESKCETFHMKMSSACSFIFMQIKVIFITMVSQLDSLWKRGTRELGNDPLSPYHASGSWKGLIYNHFQNEDCIIRNVDRSTKIFCNRTWILKIIYIEIWRKKAGLSSKHFWKPVE